MKNRYLAYASLCATAGIVLWTLYKSSDSNKVIEEARDYDLKEMAKNAQSYIEYEKNVKRTVPSFYYNKVEPYLVEIYASTQTTPPPS